ncbi:MAG TPA: hypothetical protein RMH85_04145 [Polyangiaceae bacterium LLY-WYZ-15_(1-7)]|nr:hypothetical protein [Myxococcales bacterium]MAT24069.1 hypothetical protein [Sandaracinus sp.]HJK90064.1 hypothetical protein [Polyangiaceae bacterium LLY-WYZ-15_(1-7)]MAC29223.1 hypothetical protein [Myxococcales bacterium]MBJ70927.1 hypothetical protein [Sandaracinus sp.]
MPRLLQRILFALGAGLLAPLGLALALPFALLAAPFVLSLSLAGGGDALGELPRAAAAGERPRCAGLACEGEDTPEAEREGSSAILRWG